MTKSKECCKIKKILASLFALLIVSQAGYLSQADYSTSSVGFSIVASASNEAETEATTAAESTDPEVTDLDIAIEDFKDAKVTWSLTGEGTPKTKISATGLLTGGSILGEKVIVTATATYNGATVSVTKDFTVEVPVSRITLTADNGATAVTGGQTLKFSAVVKNPSSDDETKVATAAKDDTIVWSVVPKVADTAKDGSGVYTDYVITVS